MPLLAGFAKVKMDEYLGSGNARRDLRLSNWKHILHLLVGVVAMNGADKLSGLHDIPSGMHMPNHLPTLYAKEPTFVSFPRVRILTFAARIHL